MTTLLIAPHPDDETYGCGATLARRALDGHEVVVVVVSVADVLRPNGTAKCTWQQRMEELSAACGVLEIPPAEVLFSGHENALDKLSTRELVTRLDKVMSRDFSEVLFPGPSHHQDHMLVHRACWASLRARPGRRAERVTAMYELPYGDWPIGQPAGSPHYVNVAATIDRKEAALREYASQLQPAPYPLSVEAARTLAKKRGTEVGLDYAERLELVRSIEW